MVDTIKFSQMTAGGDLTTGEQIPGLLSGGNVLFTQPWAFLPPGSTAARPTPSAAVNYLLRFNTDDQLYEYYDAVLGVWTQLQENTFAAGPFVTYTVDSGLPDAFNLGLLASGILKQTVSVGVATPAIAVNGVDYYGPGFTGYYQAPSGIKDSNGNIVLQFNDVASSVNYIGLINSITSVYPTIQALGSDSNIGMTFLAKASAPFVFTTTANTAFTFQTGTLSQHITNFIFPNTLNNWNATWQDSSGTVAWLSDVAGTVTSLTGTANQVLVNGTTGTPETGAITLTLPQDIATTSSPTFAALTLTAALTVPNGGTGIQTSTAYGILAGGITSTGAFQSLSTGTSGQLLQSNGSSALPSWTTATFPAGSGTLNHMLRSDGTNWVQTTATTLDSSDNFAGITSAAIGNLSLSGNTLSSTNTNGNIDIIPNGSGQILAFSTTPVPIFANCVQLIIPGSDASFVGASYRDLNTSSVINFVKSRGSSVGSFKAVDNGDTIGALRGWADNGASIVFTGGIAYVVSAPLSGTFVPTALTFSTSSTTVADVLALTIDHTQAATFTNTITAAGKITATAGALISGTSAGGTAGLLTLYSTTAALGSMNVTSANNAGNYANELINASTSAARTWTLPDASGTIALASTNGGLIPNSVSGTIVSMAGGNAYFLNNAAASTGTLPASGSSTIGDVIKVKGASAAPFIIQANTSQVITDGSTSSTTAGTATSNAGTDSIQMVYVAANTWSVDWQLSLGFTLA